MMTGCLRSPTSWNPKIYLTFFRIATRPIEPVEEVLESRIFLPGALMPLFAQVMPAVATPAFTIVKAVCFDREFGNLKDLVTKLHLGAVHEDGLGLISIGASKMGT